MEKILTVGELIRIFEERNFTYFSSETFGKRLKVRVPAVFEVSDEVDDAHRGMMRVKIKVFHTGLNRNGSFVSEESAANAMPSIKNRPILASIHQLDDGSWDFEGHNMEIVELEDGTQETVYIERQVGSFSEEDPFFEYDEENDKNFVCAYGWISEEYTKAAEIIRKKNGTKNSVELSIDELSFNAKEKYLDLIAFYVEGSTLLGSRKDGTQIGEGMLGSRVDISDFEAKGESVSSYHNAHKELIETLEKINITLSNFNIDNNGQKGGTLVTKFEELLNKYNVTVDDVTFEYEGMSDEDLEIKFAEVFDGESTGEGEVEPTPASDNNFAAEGSEGAEGQDNPDNQTFETMQKVYEISHEDIRYALYNLLAPYEESDNEWYWIIGVYDNHFAYENWNGGVIYGQNYTKDGDNVAFDGERYTLHRELLTDSEYAELQTMRSNYSIIQTELQKYQSAEENAKKEALFGSADYQSISGCEEFKALAENHSELSFDDLSAKLDSMLLSYAKSGKFSFAKTKPEEKVASPKMKVFTDVSTKAKKGRYGNLKFN